MGWHSQSFFKYTTKIFDRRWKFNNFKITGLISSSKDCRAVSIAKQLDLPVFIGDFSNQDKIKKQLSIWLKKTKPEWLVLAGFLKKFPTSFCGLDYLKKRIINIHPSLLPKFSGKGMYGLKVHEQVLKAKEKTSGATIHFVNNHYDQGKIIAKSEINIENKTNSQEIATAVFREECKLLPHVLSKLTSGSLPLPNSDVYIYKFQQPIQH